MNHLSRTRVFIRVQFWLQILLLGMLSLPMWPQTTQQMAKDAHPSFEVAAIKLSDPSSHDEQISTEGRRVTLRRQTLTNMMIFAYGLQKKQVVGGPRWMAVDRYDIDGVADAEGEPDIEQLKQMLRKLMTERFGLKFHNEERELDYYAVTIAKNRPQLTKSKSTKGPGNPDESWQTNGKTINMKFINVQMEEFAQGMQNFVDRPVVDETGLTGIYDFVLRWSQDGAETATPDGPPILFTAVREQLGLKLTPKKGPVPVLVIDRLERPSQN
jgi:uncharacterized protein (TIGR03435 family)